MKLSRWWILGLAVFLGLGGLSLQHFRDAATGLELATCEPQPPVITYVHFFVTNDVLKVMNKAQVKRHLEQIMDASNQVLDNSCIPLQRELKHIEYVDFSHQYLFDFGSVHFALQKAVGGQTIGKIRQTINDYYAILLGPDNTIFDDQWRGTSEMSPEGRFIALAYDASSYTLEHEMGHLAGADHDQQTLDEQASFGFEQILPLWDQKQLKPYARAALCGGAGTIMSYNQNVLPVYSQPGVFYHGEQCGDAKYANNAQVLRGFAKRLKQELLAGHWIPEPKP